MATIVTTTGTGTPIPRPERAGPGTHVQFEDTRLQFDAGRMTLTRLQQMEVDLGDLSAIFLTHYHSDHVVGLTDLLLTRWVMNWGGEAGRLPVIAPNGHTMAFLERIFTIWDNDLDVRASHGGFSADPRVEMQGFDVPDEPTEVWNDGQVRVLAGQVRHEPVVGAVGYRVETPDGVVVISGDTVVCDEMAELSDGADVVVYEAMRFDDVMVRPAHTRYVMDYHADTRLIGAQAQALNIPTVMLTHLIPAPTTEAERQLYVDDLRDGGYTGEVVVCDDLTSVEITK